MGSRGEEIGTTKDGSPNKSHAHAGRLFIEAPVTKLESQVSDLGNNVDAAVNLNDRAADDDPPTIVLVIVVGTSLINVGLAAVLLGLAGRKSAVSPAGFLTATPSRRSVVAVTIAAVLISVATLPALILIIELLVSVLMFVLLVPVICH
jgi:hypothetical protein